MKFVVDMNLSPEWKAPLIAAGHDALHWSEVGASSAPDSVLLRWAHEHGAVVLTLDVGIGSMLALTAATGPSVVILRLDRPNPAEHAGRLIVGLCAFEDELNAGALVIVDASGQRAHVLPVGRKGRA